MRLRKNKFGVSAKEDRTVDGIVFHSKKEATRYSELKLLHEFGKITNLELQPRWNIVIGDQKICTYVADFSYEERGEFVVEDAKGVKTPVYLLKKKLMKAVHNIDIRET